MAKPNTAHPKRKYNMNNHTALKRGTFGFPAYGPQYPATWKMIANNSNNQNRKPIDI